MASKLLSVIIPAFNESDRLGPRLKPVLAYLDSNYPKFELIIVDDGSRDDTREKVSESIKSEKRAMLISYTPNRGKGFAVKTGVLASKGDTVLFMDADLSTPLTEIPRILSLLEGNDIVIGSRGSARSQVDKPAPLYRRLASFIFDQIKYFLVGLRNIKDTQCGFKVFRGEVARMLFQKSQVERFMFDVEILYLAQKSNLKIVEMPVSWADVPGSHVKFWEGIVNMFKDLWRIRYTNKYE